MRLTWPQHLQVSRSIETSGDAERGMALALMGVSLLILLEDLLDEIDETVSSTPSRQHD